MKGKLFTCDLCGDKCASSWDEAEAVAEYEAAYGRFDRAAVIEICEPCFNRMKWQEAIETAHQ